MGKGKSKKGGNPSGKKKLGSYRTKKRLKAGKSK
jgi:hypothetical protein